MVYDARRSSGPENRPSSDVAPPCDLGDALGQILRDLPITGEPPPEGSRRHR